jgi:SAM-dependent methyltransferase
MGTDLEFDPLQYWRQLIVGDDPGDVDQVGHPDMGRGFNRLAYRLRLRALQKALVRSGHFPPDDVFEAAFGVGFYLRFWHGVGCPRVVGAELSERTHKTASDSFPDFDLRCADLASINDWHDWPELTSSFGLVTAIDVLYHIIDDSAAFRALDNLGHLVRPGGILLVTEKFPKGAEPDQECVHVRRRPLDWYKQVLAPQGFALERTVPIFWCMDPPTFKGGKVVSARLAYTAWCAMRACTKFWPRNGRMQNLFGSATGRVGMALDQAIVPFLGDNPNLTAAVFRKG